MKLFSSIEYNWCVENKIVYYFENRLFYSHLSLEKYTEWPVHLGIFRVESVPVHVPA